MNDGLLVDDFVDRNRGVNDLLLNDFSLDDWLDSLVNVVVGHVLTNSSHCGSRYVGWESGCGVLVGVLLSCESLLRALAHLVGLLSVLNSKGVVLVNFG